MTPLDSDARAFLENPWIARLATAGADGWPHVVPLWYMLDGDDIVITSERKTGKVANLLRDNRAAIVVGGEPDRGPAYLLRGRVTITGDPDHAWLEKMTRHYESDEEAARDLAAWAGMDIAILRMTIDRVTKVF